MKKSVWSAYFLNAAPEEMVLYFEQAGYNYCELSFEHGGELLEREGTPEEIGTAFKNYAKEHGMTFTQGHLPLSYKICQNKEDLERMKDWLDLYNAIGIKYCVLHCDKFIGIDGVTPKKRFDWNVEALRELGVHIKDTDLVICLENLNIYPITADELLELLDALDKEHFAICLDTGHLHMNQGDLTEFIQKAGKRIKALHIADNEGREDQHMMPCGRGGIDFVSVFKELKKVGYDELYNLEIPGENSAPHEVLMLKLNYINKMMDILDELS